RFTGRGGEAVGTDRSSPERRSGYSLLAHALKRGQSAAAFARTDYRLVIQGCPHRLARNSRTRHRSERRGPCTGRLPSLRKWYSRAPCALPKAARWLPVKNRARADAVRSLQQRVDAAMAAGKQPYRRAYPVFQLI